MIHLLMKIIKKEEISDEDLAEVLFDICCSEHGSCNNNCPVYLINKGIPRQDNNYGTCSCFKLGNKMLEFIRTIGKI